MEEKVFLAARSSDLPQPLELAEPAHPSRVALEKLIIADKTHRRSIDRVRTLDQQIHAEVTARSSSLEEISTVLDASREAYGLPTRQELMTQHRSQKQRYLECLRAYLSVLMRSKEVPAADKQEHERFYHQTHAVHLAHATYTAVRSYIHNQKSKILRDDNGITMHHLYSCAVHVMNDYGEDIKDAKEAGDWEFEQALYVEMKKEIVIAILHDFIEDLRDIKLQDLKETLVALTRHETDLSGAACLDHPDLEPRPADYNFIEYYWDEIIEEVRAVTKPESKDEQVGYLTKQLDTPRRVMRKARDRGNNLSTLKYMQAKPKNLETAAQVQKRKISETPEIILTGISIYPNSSDFDKKRLERSLLYLCRTGLAEITRLNENHLKEIGEPLTDPLFKRVEDLITQLKEGASV